MRPWPSSAWRRESTSTLKSPAATTPPKAHCWSRRSRNTASWCRWAPSSAPPPHTIEIVDKIHNGLVGRALLCQVLVQQHPQIHRHWQAGARSRHARLGSLAGPSPAPALQRQRAALQLALVQDLGHRRNPQQRHPRSGCLPLGPRRRLPQSCHRLRRPLPLQRRLAVLRHPRHQLRIRRQAHRLGVHLLPGHALLSTAAAAR